MLLLKLLYLILSLIFVGFIMKNCTTPRTPMVRGYAHPQTHTVNPSLIFYDYYCTTAWLNVNIRYKNYVSISNWLISHSTVNYCNAASMEHEYTMRRYMYAWRTYFYKVLSHVFLLVVLHPSLLTLFGGVFYCRSDPWFVVGMR